MIGVFDSGMGGLSVRREIASRCPDTPLCYLGDNAHIPYGLKSLDEIRAYSLEITRFLVEETGCSCLVYACNTGTAVAIELLRQTYPHIPIVGMEPGIKPAAKITRSGKIGVLATHNTLATNRLASLVERFAGGLEVITQPCPEWVELVEQGNLDTTETVRAVEKYISPLKERNVDTFVLGCTHYPFLLPVIRDIAGPGVEIIDTGPAVARRVESLLWEQERPEEDSKPGNHTRNPATSDRYFTTGDVIHFTQVARACLGEFTGSVHSLQWNESDGKKVLFPSRLGGELVHATN